MNIQKKKKSACLPQTSRVNEKIMEYYKKFGKDRDLEKFMRLHSPSNNKSNPSRSDEAISTSGTTSSCEASNETEDLRILFATRNSQQITSSESSKSESSTGIEKRSDRVIPIIFEEDEERGTKENVDSTSQEDSLETPKTSKKNLTKPTKTPDSIAKTHKRLEWDSLGDIGYMKSMSTSNISILERKILREFFQEASSYGCSSNNQGGNASDGDLQTKVRKELFLNDRPKRLLKKKYTAEASTPPLASSTVLENKKIPKNRDVAAKYSTKETNTYNIPQHQEQYVQTSIELVPAKQSQEVQVNMFATSFSSSPDSGSAATQSSREYTFVSNPNKHNGDMGNKAHEAHPFIADINKMFAQQRPLTDTTQRQRREETKQGRLTNVNNISENLVKSLSENKENASGLPKLDLGIQLLCSLIDANSLSHKEKKQLVRNIVKSITQLGFNVNNTSETESSGKMSAIVSNSSNSAKIEKSIRTIVYSSTSSTPISAKCSEETTEKSATNSATNDTSSAKLNLHKIANDINTDLSIDRKSSSSIEKGPNLKRDHIERAHSTTSSSSKNLTTEEKPSENSSENCCCSNDFDASMNEWLNPLTQSEIEYEQKKLELAAKKMQSKPASYKTTPKAEKERKVQLNWIDSEIQRLESLKNLLLNENSKDSNSETATNSSENNVKIIEKETEDKPYESVNSTLSQTLEDKSLTVSKESAGKLVQEIEVLIEESNEEQINFETNFKRTKERKRETQVAYDKPQSEMGAKEDSTGAKPRFRTVKKTVITQEDQVIPPDPPHKTRPAPQRSKIDTPSNSNESDSVCSFVRQRKREFMEHYKNRKKSEYHTDAKQKKGKLQQQQHSQNIRQSIQQSSSSSAHHPSQSGPHSSTSVRYSASAGFISIQSRNHNSHIHSSSSAFTISSEVSIPMCSNSVSSTTTITTPHQYDEVATAGISVPHTSRIQCQLRDQQRPHHSSVGTQVEPPSIAYTITFDAGGRSSQNAKLSLQQQLQLARPKFCADSKKRRAVLNKMQALRQERERELRNILENTSLQSLDRKLSALPPPPTKHTRVVSTKEMKAMTNKRYAYLPEVLSKQKTEREERQRRGNRLMRDIFNRRLQKSVRDGKLTLNHSRTVI